MSKMKLVHFLAMAGTTLLLSGGCTFDGWWPWLAGAGTLTLLGLNQGS